MSRGGRIEKVTGIVIMVTVIVLAMVMWESARVKAREKLSVLCEAIVVVSYRCLSTC